MATSRTAAQLERLQLTDDDDDDSQDLWNSPSKRRNKTPDKKSGREKGTTLEQPYPRNGNNGEAMLEPEGTREAALRHELQTVRNVNQAIEGILESLTRAKGNMETVSRTVNSASTLLNTWTRILSQTEHNQRLILNPKWQGATQDIADMENEAIQKQQAAERRELEMQQRREAAAKKAEEEKRRAEAAAAGIRGSRGTNRGRVRTGHGRSSSTSFSSRGQAPGRGTTTSSTTATRNVSSGTTRGSATARGRGKT
ncbi:DASH complex subunit Duo1 domain containing protein [Elaphomyces granulatus]